MTDQRLAVVLLPFVVLIPPAIGFLLGIRRKGALSGAIAALAASVVFGFCCGAAWAAAVDLRASSMTGGNPWIGHPRGVTATGLLLAGALGAVANTVSGLLASGLVWFHQKRRQ